ncbi:unnamed protein product [Rhizophagus irregularis]|uniref:Uncharacterized protein n=1 Tax=Rhizophagus irregularis TaxID=588596 RepID=A0A915ZBA2_9GLOM|nr:unnamed protein product [Rhizophagus irregularis]CAB4489089.1 unnamed protein product [Rhizophagus irregularis]CAB5193189.1 unnamed protein product [Rhizophagus irregularis]CAB5369422.1 unnamed protein product [Rhizophagus irregularis]CAB5369563.1 unnamed protein product [Rhizophagus irregularis]
MKLNHSLRNLIIKKDLRVNWCLIIDIPSLGFIDPFSNGTNGKLCLTIQDNEPPKGVPVASFMFTSPFDVMFKSETRFNRSEVIMCHNSNLLRNLLFPK